jgi:hypothetical protein
MPARRLLTVAETEALATSIVAMLARIERGELVASTATRHRLEGALVALQAVLRRTDDALDRLTGGAGSPPEIPPAEVNER